LHEISEVITQLIDKSLVLDEGHLRYRLLQGVQSYVAEQLTNDQEEKQKVALRHARFFLRVAEETEPDLRGEEQERWFARLGEDHHNLQAAIRWALNNSHQEIAWRFAAALGPYWETCGRLPEVKALCDRILVLPRDNVPTRTCARALNNIGRVEYGLAHYETARSLYEASLSIYESSAVDRPGDRQIIASLHNNLANVAFKQGDFELACALHKKSLSIREELEDEWEVAASLDNIGNAMYAIGDLDGATEAHERALKTWSKLGHQEGIATSLNNLGNVAYNHGDLDTALALYEQSLTRYEALGHANRIAAAKVNVASALCGLGKDARAAVLYREALVLYRGLREIGDLPWVLEGIVELMARQAETEQPPFPSGVRAARLGGAADQLWTTLGIARPPAEQEAWDRVVERLRAILSSDWLAVEWETGKQMSLEDAVAMALGEPHDENPQTG
jgi:tetratricopeptide (TPR) repeat protein